MIPDLYVKRAVRQTKWMVGKARAKVGGSAEIATSIMQTRDDSSGNGGGEKQSDSDMD